MFPPPITRTLKLPYCWVCEGRFVQDGGEDASLLKNEHHVIPRACGGTSGPTVTLCSAHHDLLHALAVAVEQGADLKQNELTFGLPDDWCMRLEYLAHVVYTAEKATQNNPNRRFLLTVELPPVYRNRVRLLQRSLGNPSYEKLLRALIDAEYNKRFPS